jgi:two-component system NtrC family sensor kinase
MRFRVNLQWRVLVLMTGGMALVLGLSAYLNDLITKKLIEEDHYSGAVTQTVAIAERIASQQLLTKPDELQRDIALVVESRPDFKQIDVYRSAPNGGWTLAATTNPTATRLPRLDERTRDNDLRELERSEDVPGLVTMEVLRGGSIYWLVSMASRPHGTSTSYVTAMVLKNSRSELAGEAQWEHNLVLAGVILVCVALAGFLITHFFRRPARDILYAMDSARGGNFVSRARVRRPDELGEIAARFNELMDDLSSRDRERDALLTRISGFNEELRAEVARATSDLRSANETLLLTQQRLGRSERLAAMGQVAASLAHEIGTPLNSISGHLQLLARRLPNDADAQRRAGIINQQLDSIVGSVRALLRRTHARRVSLRPTDLNALIAGLLRLVGPTLDAHQITVATTLDADLPAVFADPDGLHQVLLNLINNSVDAMPTGGRLTIVTRVVPTDQGRAAELIVEDTGTGFAPEIIGHLFDPMWTTKATGSGFGLAIARDVMNDHGGTIEASTATSGGAAFRLQIRLADAAAPAGVSHAG